MAKRKAATKPDPVDSDANDSAADVDVEPPAKRTRGRPASKTAETKETAKPTAQTKGRSVAEPSQVQEPATKKRGRPKGNGGRSSTDGPENDAAEKKEEPKKGTGKRNTKAQSKDDAAASEDDLQKPPNDDSKSTKSAKATKPAAARGRKKVSTEKQTKVDGEFEYTPSPRKPNSPEKPKDKAEHPVKRGRNTASEADDTVPESENPAPDVIDESILPDELAAPRSVSVSPSKAAFPRQPSHRASQSFSPIKRKVLGEDGKTNQEPELRRKLGDLTRKHEALENRYRNLREIGIVEANSNAEKLRKQCDSMATASNNLVNSLKEELEAQRALGQHSRTLQKQLTERHAEIDQFKSQAEEANNQLSSAQSEVMALQTKLSAARNTAASLESAAAKAPGSAIKGGGANRAQAAASAEAAHAAQYAQLKEDLYSDLTGLIIRDVKKRETDCLYDCIQTGINGTLHFKLTVPHVSSANFETAEFQYIPLLDENRDRDLVDILPDYLTVDITFARQQASKFYTRVIDTLIKRRNSSSGI